MIFIWKISQGLVAGYDLKFTENERTGHWAVPDLFTGCELPANVRKAKESSLQNYHYMYNFYSYYYITTTLIYYYYNSISTPTTTSLLP